MIIDHFDWDEVNVEHIARHRVIPDEVEELFDAWFYLFRTRNDRYIALGRTFAGRYLMCVFERASRSGEIRVITARDMDGKERKLYNRKA